MNQNRTLAKQISRSIQVWIVILGPCCKDNLGWTLVKNPCLTVSGGEGPTSKTTACIQTRKPDLERDARPQRSAPARLAREGTRGSGNHGLPIYSKCSYYILFSATVLINIDLFAQGIQMQPKLLAACAAQAQIATTVYGKMQICRSLPTRLPWTAPPTRRQPQNNPRKPQSIRYESWFALQNVFIMLHLRGTHLLI